MYFLKRFIITVLTALPLYLIIRRPWRFNDKREWVLCAFWIYLICLFSLTFDGSYDLPSVMINKAVDRICSGADINTRPFKTICDFIRNFNADEFCINIISNIAIFIPWGFGLPLLWKKNQKILRLLSLCLGITVFIEFFQLFICRNPDIDDVILNFTGGCIGAGLYFIIAKINPRIKDTAK